MRHGKLHYISFNYYYYYCYYYYKKYQKLLKYFGFCDTREISTAKCKSDFVYVRSLFRPILKTISTVIRTKKFSQLKVLFKYLLVYPQKQNVLNYHVEETVHASKFG